MKRFQAPHLTDDNAAKTFRDVSLFEPISERLYRELTKKPKPKAKRVRRRGAKR